MGRDRLRRGYSLEVIFEEDSDFCSQLDSLDSIPRTAGTAGCRSSVKEPSKNYSDFLRQEFSVDRLVGHQQRLSQSSDSYSSEQYEESCVDTGNSSNKSLDGFLDAKDMESCFIEWDEEVSVSTDRKGNSEDFPYEDELQREVPSSDSEYSSGRRSRVSRRQIVEANWITDEDYDCSEDTQPTHQKNQDILAFDDPPARPPVRQYIKHTKSTGRTGLGKVTHGLDAPAIVDPFDDDWTPAMTTTLTKTNVEAGLSSSSRRASSPDSILPSITQPHQAGKKSYLNSNSNLSTHLNSSGDEILSRSTSAGSSTDVKRVRALFENQGSSASETNNKFIKQASAPSSKAYANNSTTKIRSAYSQLTLHQMERYDFVDLLVNDKIIIEDSPDVFQTLRNSRIRDWGSSKLDPPHHQPMSSKSTLRRSKSVGAGIHNLEEEMKKEEMNRSRPCILAEEMPAPDTVKNARTVFEKILNKNTTGTAGSDSNNGKITNGTSHNPKALSCIKSNPTSKIFRSESLRAPKPSSADTVDARLFEFRRRGSKPTVLEQKLLAATAEVSKSKFLEEDDLPSISSNSTSTTEEVEEPKLISDDVLSRIRSLGTTTTYFGGEIVAKTVKNRKCAVVSKKKPVEDDYEPVEFVADNIFYGARSNQERNDRDSDFRPFHLPGLDNRYMRQDTAPRIISVLPKSPSSSPTKSGSPVGSLSEGRNSPEGCESPGDVQSSPEWISEKVDDTNNNVIGSKKFSEVNTGAWF